MIQMKSPPTPKVHKQLRVTVPITPEVLALFQRLSEASGKSVGRLMGEWLDETRDGLEPMIDIMLNFKKAPKAAVKALQLHAIAVSDLAADMVSQAMILGKEERSEGGGKRSATDSDRASVLRGEGGLTPPSSNTGGKGRETHKKNDRGSK
jgi:hypothetical protein